VIEGAILVFELAMLLVLLFKVWRVQQKGEGEETGFFAYRTDKSVPLPPGPAGKPVRGKPHA
jgi:hypothetical protein